MTASRYCERCSSNCTKRQRQRRSASVYSAGCEHGSGAHQESALTTGPSHGARDGQFLQESLYLFWQRTFDAMAEPLHRTDYRDVPCGNLSLPANTFARVGGFNPALTGYGIEDYELGVRLPESGVSVVHATGAHARHLETTGLDRLLRRHRRAGSAGVILARVHPRMLPDLRISRPDPVAQSLVFRAPALGVLVARGATGMLSLLQRLRMQRLWRILYSRLEGYWYWRGVSDALGSADDSRAFLRQMSLSVANEPISSTEGAGA